MGNDDAGARRRRSDDHWHLTRDVPAAWLLGLAVTSLASIAVWWLSMHDLQGEVRNIGVRLDRFEHSQYTASDALKDWTAQHDRDLELARRVGVLEARAFQMPDTEGGISIRSHIRELPR